MKVLLLLYGLIVDYNFFFSFCRFIWERTHLILGFSDVHIHWAIGPNTLPGEYRIRHFGNYKYILGGIFPYEGQTRSFTVIED